MVKRLSVLIALVVGVSVGYFAASFGDAETAEAGTKTYLCRGEAVVVVNPTSGDLSFTYQFLHSDGSPAADPLGFLVTPHGTGNISTTLPDVQTTLVQLDSGLRVLGSSLGSTGSQGYSECVKAK